MIRLALDGLVEMRRHGQRRAAVSAVAAIPCSGDIGFARGIDVLFGIAPAFIVDSKAASSLEAIGFIGAVAVDRQAIGGLDRKQRHGSSFPVVFSNTAGRPPLRSAGSRAAKRAEPPLTRRPGMRQPDLHSPSFSLFSSARTEDGMQPLAETQWPSIQADYDFHILC